MFVRALSHSVRAAIRSKGLAYYRARTVDKLQGDSWSASAIVTGTERYHVRITRDLKGFVGSCTCRYFTDREEICKHVWAVLLAAEDGRMLEGPGFLPASPSLLPDYDTLDQDEPTRRALPPAAPLPTWQRLLIGVQQQLAHPESPKRHARFEGTRFEYLIDLRTLTHDDAIEVIVQARSRKKDGGWGKPKSAAVTANDADRLEDPDDREIFTRLLGATGDAWEPSTAIYRGSYYGGGFGAARSSFRLRRAMAETILPLIARSGRTFLLGSATGPLAWDDGPAWRFELKVDRRHHDNAPSTIEIDGEFVRGDVRMRVHEPPAVHQFGFLFTFSAIARLEVDGAFPWLLQLRSSGPVSVPEDASDTLVETLAVSGIDPSSLPAELRYEVLAAPPRPCIRLSRRSRPTAAARDMLDVDVRFAYDGTEIPADSHAATFDPSQRRMIRRDLATEREALERLKTLGFQSGWARGPREGLEISVERFPVAVRALVSEGWRVEAEGRVFRAAHGIQARVTSGTDWFELHGEVDFGEGLRAPLPALLAALQRGDATVTLDDGTKGLLPEEWLRNYARIARFGDATAGDHVRFRASQAALLEALLETQPAVSLDETFRRAREGFKAFAGVQPLDAPPSFTGVLREYQRDALGWLEFLRRFGFGGCLADDMGLGKTVMVLAMLEARRVEPQEPRRPSLAVVPRSLVFNWIDEAARFAPGLRLLDYTGDARDATAIGSHDLVLTTYGTLRRDITLLRDIGFDYVILDEAQAVKNPTTAAAKAVRLLRAEHRLALSGTPIENHLGELWSLFEFLNPGLLGSFQTFQRATSGRARADRDELGLLGKAVRPFILRRTKAQVAPELPERSEQTIHCELEGSQRRLYDQLRAHYRATLLRRIARSGLNRSKIQVLEALLRLRQAACHPALIDETRRGEASAKLDVLLPRLAEVLDEGHKALVFSQFTSFLGLLRERLDEQGVAYEYLDGKTDDRASHVARFQTDPACRLFLISLKAGGVGLNLTEAEYVFLLDPWWNPAVEAQAIDRAHRIGQSKHVFAYRLIARDTVEEKVAELQQSKRELADAILSADAGMLRDLKPEDLEWLLS